MAVNTTQAVDRDSLRAAVIVGLCLPGDVLLYLLLSMQPLDGATCIQALCGERGWRRYQGLQPYLYVVGAGLLFTGLLGQYLLWAARTLLNLLPGGMLHG